MHKGQTLGKSFDFQTFLHPIMFLRPNEKYSAIFSPEISIDY